MSVSKSTWSFSFFLSTKFNQKISLVTHGVGSRFFFQPVFHNCFEFGQHLFNINKMKKVSRKPNLANAMWSHWRNLIELSLWLWFRGNCMTNLFYEFPVLNFSCLRLPLVQLITACPFNSNAYAHPAIRYYIDCLLQTGYQMCPLCNMIRPTCHGYCQGLRHVAHCYRQFRPN